MEWTKHIQLNTKINLITKKKLIDLRLKYNQKQKMN